MALPALKQVSASQHHILQPLCRHRFTIGVEFDNEELDEFDRDDLLHKIARDTVYLKYRHDRGSMVPTSIEWALRQTLDYPTLVYKLPDMGIRVINLDFRSGPCGGDTRDADKPIDPSIPLTVSFKGCVWQSMEQEMTYEEASACSVIHRITSASAPMWQPQDKR